MSTPLELDGADSSTLAVIYSDAGGGVSSGTVVVRLSCTQRSVTVRRAPGATKLAVTVRRLRRHLSDERAASVLVERA